MNRFEFSDIVLRNINENDAKLLMDMNNEPYVAKYVVGNPKHVTLEEQIKWIKNLVNEKNTIRFIIEYQSKSVGTIIVSGVDQFNKVCNLNIKLHIHAIGQGIGTKSIQAAVTYCFKELEMDCIIAHILSYNFVSQKAFLKCGFKSEGVLRSRVIKNGVRQDLISFSILKDEGICYEQ